MAIDKNTLVKSPEDWLGFFNRSVIWLPMLIFFALAVSIVFAGAVSQESLDKNTQQTIFRLTQENQLKITSKLESYELLAQSGVGLVRSGSVYNNTWNQHLSVFESGDYYEAVEGIGYASRIDNPETDDISETVKPEYFYPQTNQSEALIVDKIANNNDGNHAVVQAARSGRTTMTDLIDLSSVDKNKQDFVLFSPVYSNDLVPESELERIKQFRGVVYVIFDSKTFFDGIYGGHDSDLFHLSIYHDKHDDKTSVYESGSYPSGGDAVSYRQTLLLFGQQLVNDYSFSNKVLVPASQRLMPSILLFAGIGLSLMVAIVVSLSLRSRNQRLSITREREIQAAKDELLSLASHQLRTPATGVKQYMGMVIQGFAGEITDQQRDFLERAYASNERQLHVINDILHLAKLEAGQIVLSKTRLNLVEIVHSVVDELSADAQTAQIKLTVKTPKKAIAMADSHMFRMVLENLVTNAIKYTDPGGKVTINLVRDGEYYKISVSDTGVGIAARDMDKLFTQFSRIPNKRSSVVTGTGVGLYLAKSLIKLHEGDIRVSSVPNKGSVFTISLPRGL